MANKPTRKMRNFKKMKHVRASNKWRSVKTKRADSLQRSYKRSHPLPVERLYVGISEHIQQKIQYNKNLNALGVTTSENTITAKILHSAIGHVSPSCAVNKRAALKTKRRKAYKRMCKNSK